MTKEMAKAVSAKEVQITDDDQVRIGPSEYKGKIKIDIRKYYRKEDGSYGPTQKGMRLDYEQFEEVVRALVETAKELGIEI